MYSIINVSSNNTYLTEKEWEEVKEYVKNRRILTDSSTIEEIPELVYEEIQTATSEPVMMFSTRSDEVHSDAYNQMAVATSISEMYEIMLTIMNDNPESLYDMSADEIQALYDDATGMNNENPSNDYADLIDTLQLLAGDYKLNDVELLVTETWSGTISAKTFTGTGNVVSINGTCTLTGKITVSNNTDLIITGQGIIQRDPSYLNELFNVYGTGTLIIKGTSTSNPIIIDGGSTGTKANVRTMIRCDNALNLENVELRNNNTTVVRDYSIIDKWDDTADNFAGGAITLCDNENNVTIKNCKIYNNSSTYGAGIYLNRTGSGTLTIENTTFDNCNTTSGGGCAIFFDGRPGTNEVVPSNGYLNYIVNITNTVIQNCTSAGCGSAIYFHRQGKAEVMMQNCTVQNCISQSSSCGTLRCDGNSRYKLIIDNCLIQNNESQNTGGHGAGVYWNALGEGASLIIRNNTRILNNIAGGQGGGLFVEGSHITVTDTIIKGNQAAIGGGIGIKTFADSSLSVADGVTGTSFNLTLGEGVVVEENVATTKGGGISYDIVSGVPASGFVFNYTNDGAIIRNNSVTATDGIGGGIAIIDEMSTGASTFPNRNYTANTFIKSGLLQNNHAVNGGAAHITVGNFEMTGGTIDSHSTTGSGAGVYVSAGNVKIDGGTITNNNSVENGGAIYLTNGSFTMNNGILNNNTSENSGGAVYVTGGNANINSGTITNNIALENGGAMYVANGDLVIGIKSCRDAGETSTHEHPTIKDNIAADGGGICVNGGETTMYCGNITGNRTYKETVNVLVTEGSFTYNGGTIGIPFDSGVYVTGGNFIDNTTDENKSLRYELHYHSSIAPKLYDKELLYNHYIPKSKWIGSPKGDVLHIDSDDNAPTWGDLFPKHKFVGWKNNNIMNTDKVFNLYAQWEEN